MALDVDQKWDDFLEDGEINIDVRETKNISEENIPKATDNNLMSIKNNLYLE